MSNLPPGADPPADGTNGRGQTPPDGSDEASSEAVPLARPVPVLAPWRPRQRHPMLLLNESHRSCLTDLAIFILAAALMLSPLYVAGRWLQRQSADADGLGEPVATTSQPSEPARTPEELRMAFVATLGLGLAAVLITAAIAALRRQRPAAFGLTSSSLGWDMLFGLAATGLALGLSYSAAVAISMLPGGYDLLTKNVQRIDAQLPQLSIPAAALSLLWVGFYEELVFRGFLMPRLRRATGSWAAAIVVSSALFALPHIGSQLTVAIVPLFLVALCFALFTMLRLSLIPAIIGHWLFDLSNVLYLEYVLRRGAVTV